MSDRAKLALSVNETSERIGAGRNMVYALIRQGNLTARKLGKRTVILPADLDDCLRNLPVAQIGRGSDATV